MSPYLLTVLIALIASYVASYACCQYLRNTRGFLAILDHPNQRSLHSQATPRTGGLGILAGVLIGWGGINMVTPLPDTPLIIGGISLFLVILSLLDDIRHIPAAVRLLFHLLTSCLFLYIALSYSQTFDISGIGILLYLIGIVWFINLYNFMDGMDGLAGGMTLIGFSAYGIIGLLQNDHLFAVLSLVIAVSASGFLRFNFPSATLFMGDSGSIPLGFLAATFAIWGIEAGYFSPLIPVVIFAPFIGDATLTLIKRIIRRERIWEAHKGHYYQRLVQMRGNSHLVLYLYLSLMLICATTAILANTQGDHIQAILYVIILLAFVTLFVAIDRKWNRFLNEQSRN